MNYCHQTDISASLSGDEISDVLYFPLRCAISHPELYIPYKLATVFQAIRKKYYSLQIMVLPYTFYMKGHPVNTILTFTYYTKSTICICNQLLECDNTSWVRVYNIIICIPMGSCRINICIPMGSSIPSE